MKKHEWRENLPDGDVRFVSAVRQGGRWRFQTRLKSEDEGTKLDTLPLEDLQVLRDLLERTPPSFRDEVFAAQAADLSRIVPELATFFDLDQVKPSGEISDAIARTLRRC